MGGTGRPLRFLAVILGLWLSGRVLMLGLPMLWSAGSASADGRLVQQRPVIDHGGSPSRTTALAMRSRLPVAGTLRPRRPAGRGPSSAGALRSPVLPMPGWNGRSADRLMEASARFLTQRHNPDLFDRLTEAAADSPGRADAIFAGGADGAGRRWSMTAWLLWRPEVGAGFAQSPLLGGSQAGMRFDYRLAEGRAGRASAYARLSRALTGPSSEEGAIGLAWRPGRLPVSLLAERRQRLGPGGRSGFAVLAAGGAGPSDVAPRIEAEGYAQAGIVGAPGLDGFADGKASLGYRLTADHERHDLTLGASLSGSAQPGAERLDVGPELRLRLPVGSGGLRLSTEWRERIAGAARPARGPAITLIAVF